MGKSSKTWEFQSFAGINSINLQKISLDRYYRPKRPNLIRKKAKKSAPERGGNVFLCVVALENSDTNRVRAGVYAYSCANLAKRHGTCKAETAQL
jgi:hypothetical protein